MTYCNSSAYNGMHSYNTDARCIYCRVLDPSYPAASLAAHLKQEKQEEKELEQDRFSDLELD